ncbi:MAG: hypothetical protein V4808_01710 [Pseudomonadota bacterium]
MTSLRAIVRAHRGAAALLLAMALLLRVVVPAGFMPSMENGQMVVGVCNSTGPSTVVIDIPGLEHKKDVQKGCAFSDLSLSSLAGTDPLLIAALIAFMMALGLVFAHQFPPRAPVRLRPPLRGPPPHP